MSAGRTARDTMRTGRSGANRAVGSYTVAVQVSDGDESSVDETVVIVSPRGQQSR